MNVSRSMSWGSSRVGLDLLRAVIAASPIVVRRLAAGANARISALIAEWHGSSVALRNVDRADVEMLDWLVAQRRDRQSGRVLM